MSSRERARLQTFPDSFVFHGAEGGSEADPIGRLCFGAIAYHG
ncbi:MAG: DNA cytosine methyltransferase [Acidimicrobiia bacterium]|nr:DNA cytosine methyltransferase [Acidimicrobiia bacterium]MYB23650.1 DNA cytosine methyltransferase [Acidimicrobiia bacterium]MYE67307.1 DNA cytosine methyltransferase [Acidimicrobiia bacterium]